MHAKHSATVPDAQYKFSAFLPVAVVIQVVALTLMVVILFERREGRKGGRKEGQKEEKIKFPFHFIQKQMANMLIKWYGVAEKLQTK